MNIIKKMSIWTISLLLMFSFTNTALAQADSFGVDYGGGEDMFGMSYVGEIGLAPGIGFDPRGAIVNIIRYLLTFIGIIAVGIVMLAGVKWMVSGGDATKVAEARSMIFGSFIGIIIIMAAYSLTNFVINSMSGALAGGIYGI